MSSQSGTQKRPLDTAATIAVILTLGVSLINLVVSLGLVMLLVVLAAYVIVVMRAPSVSRWACSGVLVFVLIMAYFAALKDSGGVDDAASGGSALVSSLLVTAVICLPLVYMRARTPKAKPALSPETKAKDES